MAPVDIICKALVAVWRVLKKFYYKEIFNNSPKERKKIAHKTIFNDSFAALFARQSFPVFFSFWRKKMT